MGKLILFFTKKIETKNKMELSKAKALASVNIIGFIFMFLYIILTFVSGQYKDSFFRKLGVPFVLNFVFIIDLYVLKKGNLKLAGNLLPFLLVTVFLSFLFVFASETHINYYVAGYYHVILFMSLGALFSDRKFITINFFVAVVFVVLIFFLYHVNQYDAFSHFVQTGFLNYLFALVGMYLILFFVNKFNLEALSVSEEANNKTIQIDELEELFASVNNVSSNLETQSQELNNSQSSIEKAVTRQASNIEEVSTAIEEITQTIMQGTSSAKNIADFSNNTLLKLKNFSKEFVRYQNEALQINDFTETIKGISEKTDILAINASIEASRAGEFSGGFKVIAEEIRQLAEVSRNTADQVLMLVDNLSNSSNQFKGFIDELNNQMDLLSKDTNGLATGLDEERLTLIHISNSLGELSSDAQKNADIAKEVLSSSELLNRNSKELEGILAKH